MAMHVDQLMYGMSVHYYFFTKVTYMATLLMPMHARGRCSGRSRMKGYRIACTHTHTYIQCLAKVHTIYRYSSVELISSLNSGISACDSFERIKLDCNFFFVVFTLALQPSCSKQHYFYTLTYMSAS